MINQSYVTGGLQQLQRKGHHYSVRHYGIMQRLNSRIFGIFLSIYKFSLEITFSAASFNVFMMKLNMISSGTQQRISATAAATAYYGITRKLLPTDNNNFNNAI